MAGLPDQIIIARRRATRSFVTDPIILYFVGNPIPAKIATDNAKRITFTWKLTQVRNNVRSDSSDLFLSRHRAKGDRRHQRMGQPGTISQHFPGPRNLHVEAMVMA